MRDPSWVKTAFSMTFCPDSSYPRVALKMALAARIGVLSSPSLSGFSPRSFIISL